jgi:manganese-dependent inorganic pyrophosphatase
MLVMPVGSTSTIIANKFFWKDVRIPHEIAGLLLSAILSDTVIFKSPTTTEKDKEIAEKLWKERKSCWKG